MAKHPQKKRRKRRSYKELFLAELRKQSQGEQKLVANEALRGALGWNPDLYKRVKGDLFEEHLVIVGRGRGGTVGLAAAPGAPAPKALQVFISYSHEDEATKTDLLKHLEPLKRLNLIEDWHDRKIGAGDKWGDAVAGALEKADIIILIVSIDFINSRYCYDIELECALDRERAGEAIVIPVIARNCMWQSMNFAHLQALPTDAKAVASWSDRDDALTAVAEGIRKVAERLMAER